MPKIYLYLYTKGAIAIGLAVGRPARTQNTLLANFLLFTENYTGHLNQIVEADIPSRFANLAVDYVRQQRLADPHSELEYDQEDFSGITIISDLLPKISAVHGKAVVSNVLAAKHEENRLINISAQSKSRAKAELQPRDASKRSRTHLKPPCTPPAASRGPPAPPPPLARDVGNTTNTFARPRPSQDVPPPPLPLHGYSNTAGNVPQVTSRWTPSLGASWSWHNDNYSAGRRHNTGWTEG